MLKLLPNQINVINIGSESVINNKIQVIVERDAESNDKQTEKTRKMWISLDQQNDQWFEFRQG